MMKPVVRLLISFILAVIICQGFYMVFSKEIKKYEVHNTDRLGELFIHHTNFDLLFLGSSRTHFSINPYIIDSICGVNSYNAGVEGGNLYEFEMFLEAYLENHIPPKFLVLTLDLNSFSPGMRLFNYPVYFPFIQNKIIRKYMVDNGHQSMLKTLFPFLKITDYDDDSKGFFVKALLGKTEIPDNDFQYKGYISNTSNVIRQEEPVSSQSNYIISSERRLSLDSILKKCREKNIKLILTYAPEYKGKYQLMVKNSNEILDSIQVFALRNNLPFLRDDKLTICTNPLLFANIAHLNKEGAKVYSAILAGELTPLIK